MRFQRQNIKFIVWTLIREVFSAMYMQQVVLAITDEGLGNEQGVFDRLQSPFPTAKDAEPVWNWGLSWISRPPQAVINLPSTAPPSMNG